MSAFRSKSLYTSEDQLKRMRPIVQHLLPLINFAADCVQPEWRSTLKLCPLLEAEPQWNGNLRGRAFLRDGTLTHLAPYQYMLESIINTYVRGKIDPRLVAEPGSRPAISAESCKTITATWKEIGCTNGFFHVDKMPTEDFNRQDGRYGLWSQDSQCRSENRLAVSTN